MIIIKINRKETYNMDLHDYDNVAENIIVKEKYHNER